MKKSFIFYATIIVLTVTICQQVGTSNANQGLEMNLQKMIRDADAVVLATVSSHTITEDTCFPRHTLSLTPQKILKGHLQPTTVLSFSYTSVTGKKDCGEITLRQHIAQKTSAGSQIIFLYSQGKIAACFDVDDPLVQPLMNR